MIRVSGLRKSFATQDLFSDVTFTINEGEKVGLIGRNGHGKSTLLKIIKGEVLAEAGEVVIREGKTLESLDQHISFTKNTVREEACLGLRSMEIGHEWLAAKLLYGLGFSEDEQQLHPTQFSGGYQTRIMLAKLLLSRPDILLLDEPTNFLDITSLRWLEQYLSAWKGTCILVTHDSTFMERVVRHTMALHRGGIKKAKGGPAKLRRQIAHEEQIHEKTRLNQEKKDAKTQHFINTFRSGARSAGLVQSRIKMIAKRKKLPKLPPIPPVSFRFASAPFEADFIMKAHSLRFGYEPNEELLHGLNVSIRPGDRIGIVGPNGRGKSTLLNILSQQLEPNGGTVKHNKDTLLGTFQQMHHALEEPEKTVYEFLRGISTTHEDQVIHKLCGSLMFEGGKRHKKLKVLSGGERARLHLGRLMLLPHNVLFFDEPTNHLDMESCAALAKAIDQYDGAVVCVTHDEALLRSFAKKLIVFDSGKVEEFRGGYADFLDRKGWQDSEVEVVRESPVKKKTALTYAEQKEAQKQLRVLAKKIKIQERIVMDLEQELEKHEEARKIAERKGQKLKLWDLSIVIAKTSEQITAAFSELEQYHAEHDAEVTRITLH